MKTKLFLSLLVCALLVGCTQTEDNRISESTSRESAASPADKTDAPVASSTTVGDGQAKPLPGKPAKPAIVTLVGGSFSGESFQPPRLEQGGKMQLLQHYGSLTAEAKLVYDTTRVRITLKPRPSQGSVPVVGLVLERTEGGKYGRFQVLADELVTSDEDLVKEFKIPKGTYRVTLQYFRSSKEARSQLEIHRITFEP